MPIIELSDSLYRRLLRQSLSFDDTAEEVIRRLLDQADVADPLRRQEIKGAIQAARAKPGSILPVRAYWKPMLELIVEAGGSAPANEVVDALGERMGHQFMPRDLEQLESGEIRWRNRARFARLRMTQQGLLDEASARGSWEITDAGREYLEAG